MSVAPGAESTADAEYVQLRDELARGWAALPDKPEETLDGTLRALWCAAAGDPCSVERALERELPALSPPQREQLAALVRRRAAAEPLAHLTGRQRFLGLELMAGPQALIPRKETELLARAGLEVVGTMPASLAIDVCTGSGNVAVALAARAPGCVVHAADLSADAVALARANARIAGVESRVHIVAGDLFAGFDSSLRGAADLVTCNPPYIPTARLATLAPEIAAHEPSLAFDGGALGVRVLFRVLAEAPGYLRPGGWLCLEVGAGQADAVRQRAARMAEYDSVGTRSDDRGIARVVMARRTGA